MEAHAASTARLGPRVVVAGTHSNVGKTTVATGLLAALRKRGVAVAGAKVGPDFIDPGYHSLACGRPPRNLDAWMCGPGAVAPLAARAAAGAELLVVEGVMGLFDGAADGTPASTADVARLLDAPVVLVVDAAAMSSSVAALVHGYLTHDPTVKLAGVILNRVGSDVHEALLREALASQPVPVLGVLRRDDRMVWRDRHLGLVPVAEDPAAVAMTLERLAAAVEAGVDVGAIAEVARAAPEMGTTWPPLPPPSGNPARFRPRVAMASGPAFTFAYTDTVEALEAAGCEVVGFDPLTDEALPEATNGILIGGGFPEVYASQLGANRALLGELRAAGVPVWAECGGLLVLCRSLDGQPMAGLVPADATMTERLTLGYRTATVARACALGPAGTTWRGHEFHYSAVAPGGDALTLASRWGGRPEGWGGPDLLATYLHLHPGGDPAPVAAFAARCFRQAGLA
ncbi:MAG TPA: cobyrinate a,c-diamide synthase [Acidimicrobiales bacterium]